MFLNSKALREKAWNQLKISYWQVLAASIIVFAVLISLAPLAIVVSGPLLVGQSYYLIDIAIHNNEGKNYNIFIEPFKKSLINSIVANVLMGIFIFLWSLLLVIPGIIKYYSYSMTHYVIADNPDIDFLDALKKSEELMHGNKWRLFKLYFSFIGWFILASIPLGLGLIFLYPYIQLATANFYVDLRDHQTVEVIVE